MSTVAIPPVLDRVLDALGPGITALAGPLLGPLVSALVAPLSTSDELLQQRDIAGTARPAPPLWDLTTSPYPAWLGQVAGLAVPASLDVPAARAYVAGRGVSRRGTLVALKAAVAATLTGSARVVVVERDGGDPYTVRVVTYTSQTPDAARSYAAALTEKPVGLLLVHEVAGGQDYAITTADGLTYAAHTATGRSYAGRSSVIDA